MNIITFVQSWLSAKANSERGAGLAEYALLLALIAVVCVAALTALGAAISGTLTAITGSL
jgi:pilus assembly protein Flp/PilA